MLKISVPPLLINFVETRIKAPNRTIIVPIGARQAKFGGFIHGTPPEKRCNDLSAKHYTEINELRMKLPLQEVLQKANCIEM